MNLRKSCVTRCVKIKLTGRRVLRPLNPFKHSWIRGQYSQCKPIHTPVCAIQLFRSVVEAGEHTADKQTPQPVMQALNIHKTDSLSDLWSVLPAVRAWPFGTGSTDTCCAENAGADASSRREKQQRSTRDQPESAAKQPRLKV